MRILLIISFLASYLNDFSQDTLTVYSIYGSKPIAKDEIKWFGGKLGGHVGLGINADSIFHFNPRGQVKALNMNSALGIWRLSQKQEFLETFHYDSIQLMIIKIPVSHEEWLKVRTTALEYRKNSPYEYAFFGMRCAAACYDLLSIGDVVPKLSKRKMTRKIFYPRKLRKKLLKTATEHHWNVEITEGSSTRKWDHD